MPRWYRPELPVGPARAAPATAPNPAAPDYWTAYAVRSVALPIAVTPALPAPPNPTPVDVSTALEPTRCIQQLTWTPSVVVVEPGAPERIATMALPLPCPSAPTVGDVHSAPVPQQARPEHVASSHLGSASGVGRD